MAGKRAQGPVRREQGLSLFRKVLQSFMKRAVQETRLCPYGFCLCAAFVYIQLLPDEAFACVQLLPTFSFCLMKLLPIAMTQV